MFCQNCGAKNEDAAVFCESCGSKLAGIPPTSAEAETEQEAGAPEKPAEDAGAQTPKAEKPRRTKKVLIACAVLIAAAAAGVFGVDYIFFGSKQSPTEAMAAIEAYAMEHPGPGMNVLSCGYNHTVALKRDGTVVATGENDSGQCNVSGLFSRWKDIVAVSAGNGSTVGLKFDGTVVATGNLGNFAENVIKDWSDIIAVSATGEIVGLRRDGTVVSESGNFDAIKGWTDVVSIRCDAEYLYGLKKDGTIVTVDQSGEEIKNEYSYWKDIVDFTQFEGIKKDGTLVRTGGDIYDQEYDNWTDITALIALSELDMGLKKDGTVIVSGRHAELFKDWSGIVAISGLSGYFTGLKENGTVVAIALPGYDYLSEQKRDVSKWSDIAVVSKDYYNHSWLESTSGAPASSGTAADNNPIVGQWLVDEEHQVTHTFYSDNTGVLSQEIDGEIQKTHYTYEYNSSSNILSITGTDKTGKIYDEAGKAYVEFISANKMYWHEVYDNDTYGSDYIVLTRIS